MVIDMITVEDLKSFRHELLEEIKKLLSLRQPPQNRWLKSHQVRRVLTISPGTLQQLRLNGTLPFTKIGGVIFYDAEDIDKMLIARKQNSEFLSPEKKLHKQ